MLKYFLLDSETSILLTTKEYAERCEKLGEIANVKVMIFDEEIRTDALITPGETLVCEYLILDVSSLIRMHPYLLLSSCCRIKLRSIKTCLL